jgi:hypothetical protein
VTSAARVGIEGVEHGRPLRRAKCRPVKRGRPWIDDARVVHVSSKRGRSRRDPGPERGSLGAGQESAVRVRIEGGEVGSPVAGRERRRRVRGRHARDRAQERRRAPPRGGGSCLRGRRRIAPRGWARRPRRRRAARARSRGPPRRRRSGQRTRRRGGPARTSRRLYSGRDGNATSEPPVNATYES